MKGGGGSSRAYPLLFERRCDRSSMRRITSPRRTGNTRRECQLARHFADFVTSQGGALKGDTCILWRAMPKT